MSTNSRFGEGITVGLIDSMLHMARVVASRDLSPPDVQEALKNLADEEHIGRLIGREVDSIRATLLVNFGQPNWTGVTITDAGSTYSLLICVLEQLVKGQQPIERPIKSPNGAEPDSLCYVAEQWMLRQGLRIPTAGKYPHLYQGMLDDFAESDDYYDWEHA